ncbi:hypothetical protein JCM19047_364 [Bacillus sp. JCM 19047]|nr:hypothetical protein JCM19047_364 [Bacillus sp. JCM 19047]
MFVAISGSFRDWSCYWSDCFLNTVLLGKGKQSYKIVYVLATIAIIGSLGLLAYGLVVVRGFEGASNLSVLSITVIISAMLILYFTEGFDDF